MVGSQTKSGSWEDLDATLVVDVLAGAPGIEAAEAEAALAWWQDEAEPGEGLADFLVRSDVLIPGAQRTLPMVQRGYLSLGDPGLLLRPGAADRLRRAASRLAPTAPRPAATPAATPAPAFERPASFFTETVSDSDSDADPWLGTGSAARPTPVTPDAGPGAESPAAGSLPPWVLRVLPVLVEGGGDGPDATTSLLAHAAPLTRALGARLGLAASSLGRAVEAARVLDLARLVAADGERELPLALAEHAERAARTRHRNEVARAVSSHLPREVAELLGHALDLTRAAAFAADPSSPPTLTATAVGLAELAVDVTDGGRSPADLEMFLRLEASRSFGVPPIEELLALLRERGLLAPEDRVRPAVVLVDPSREEAVRMEGRLLAEGFEVRTFTDGAEAWRSIQRARPALILSEVAMPGLDGFSLLELVREEETTRALPFAFLSHLDQPAVVKKALDLGVAEFLIKNEDADVLAARVRRVLERSRPGPTADTPGRTLSGDLGEMALLDVLQMMGAARRTVRIEVASPRGDGEIHLHEGALTRARCGERSGEEAFFDLLALGEGNFAVSGEGVATDVSASQDLDYLILEGMRRLDEAREAGEAASPDEATTGGVSAGLLEGTAS